MLKRFNCGDVCGGNEEEEGKMEQTRENTEKGRRDLRAMYCRERKG